MVLYTIFCNLKLHVQQERSDDDSDDDPHFDDPSSETLSINEVDVKGDGSIDHNDSGLGTSKHRSIGSNVSLYGLYITLQKCDYECFTL